APRVAPPAAARNALPAKFAVAVRTSQLRRDVDAALIRPDGTREVVAESKITKPDVTTADLAKKYPTYIVVDRGSFRLRFFKDLKLSHTYPIAVGQQGLETPAGLYHIQDKQVNPSWPVPTSAQADDRASPTIS